MLVSAVIMTCHCCYSLFLGYPLLCVHPVMSLMWLLICSLINLSANAVNSRSCDRMLLLSRKSTAHSLVSCITFAFLNLPLTA